MFITHFLGEILPLSVLFWLQAKIYKHVNTETEVQTVVNEVEDNDKIRSTILTADVGLRDTDVERENS